MKKRLKYNATITFAFISIIFSSCNNSIYVFDPIDPRLPIYSEIGNNVAGAFIDDELWRSQVSNYNSNHRPRVVFNKTTKRLDLFFRGDSNIYDKMIFSLTLDKDVEKVEDLAELNETKLVINGTKNIGTLIKKSHFSSSKIKPNNSNGQLFIKNASFQANESKPYIIISGTFGFEKGNIKIHYGRFDYKIYNDDFIIATN